MVGSNTVRSPHYGALQDVVDSLYLGLGPKEKLRRLAWRSLASDGRPGTADTLPVAAASPHALLDGAVHLPPRMPADSRVQLVA